MHILANHFKVNWVNFFYYGLPFLVAFGVYLGRFLRFNSWDIIKDPLNIISESVNYIIYPFSYLKVWGFVLVFGSFLHIIQMVKPIKRYQQNPANSYNV